MKKLSHRQLVLVSHLTVLLHPAYWWLRELTGFRSDWVYLLLSAINLTGMVLSNRSQAQMDECADRAMKEADSVCFTTGVIAMPMLGIACILETPWANLRTVGILLFTVASVLMALRGVIFSILDKQGLDEC